jgi:hypothetical protein
MLRHYRNKHGMTSLKKRDTVPQREGYAPPPPLTEGYTPQPPPQLPYTFTPKQQQQQPVISG